MKTTIAVAFGAALVAVQLATAADPPAQGRLDSQRQSTPAVAPARTEDEKAIRATFDTFAQAYQTGDAKTLANLFTPEGEAVDAEGGILHGRDNLLQHYTSEFAAGPGDKIKATIESVTFLDANLARSSGVSEITPRGEGAPHTSRFHGIHLRSDGRWLLASIRELPSPELTAREHLKQLEWLVGDWVEESPNAIVYNSFQWSEDKSVLHRTFSLQVKGKAAINGTQRIGWDPLTKQIKSWLFDSRGGYGDALWVREGNQWMIKATGVRNDGRVATATQILTYINNDRLQWKSIDRTLGQDAEPDILEITMSRKPPQPKAAAAQP